MTPRFSVKNSGHLWTELGKNRLKGPTIIKVRLPTAVDQDYNFNLISASKFSTGVVSPDCKILNLHL